jgi:hypothetical protein
MTGHRTTRADLREAAWRALRFSPGDPDAVTAALELLAALDHEAAGDRRSAAFVRRYLREHAIVEDGRRLLLVRRDEWVRA